MHLGLSADPGRDDRLNSAEVQVRFSFAPPLVLDDVSSYLFTLRTGTEHIALLFLNGLRRRRWKSGAGAYTNLPEPRQAGGTPLDRDVVTGAA
jgi:hypothetical protein